MADNYGMEVKASVKLPTSADIDKQIRKLEKSISKLQVSGKFEESTLKNLTNQLNTLKANIATASFSQDALQTLTTQINNALQGIQINNIGNGNQAQQAGQNIGRQLKESISSALRSGIDGSSIDTFAERLKGIGVADSTIEETVKRLRELEYTIEKIKGRFSEKDGVISLTGLDIVAKDGADTLNIIEKLAQKTGEWKREINVTSSFKESQTGIKQAADETDRLAKQAEEAARQAERLNTVLKNREKASGDVGAAEVRFRDIDDAQNVKIAIEEANNALREFNALGDDATLHQQEQEIEKVRSAVKKLKEEIKAYNDTSGKNISITDVDKLNADAKTLENTLRSFASKNSGFEEFTADIKGTEVSLEYLLETLKDVDSNKSLKTLESQAKALMSTFKQASEIGTINTALSDGTYESKFEAMIAKTQQWTNASGQARINTDALELAWRELSGAKTDEEKIRWARELDAALSKTSEQVRFYNAEWAKDTQVSALHQRVQEFYDKNSATHRKWGAQLKSILDKTGAGAELTKQDLQKLSNEFINIGNAARQAGKLGQSWFDKLKSGMSAFSVWTSATSLVMKGVQITRDMIQNVREFDDSLLELSKVSDLSAEGLAKVTDEAYKLGERVGRTGKQVVDAVTEFKRAGFELNDSMDMAESALVMTNVAEGIDDTADAAGTLISVLKGYNMSESETMSIVDKINQVSNTSPIGFDQIAEGLERTAGTMAQSGTTIDETIGLITAGYAQLRNVEKVSTSLITLSARLRGVDENGDVIDGLSAELQDSFGKIGVAIEDADGNLRSIYAIAKDYAEVLPTLSSKQKQYYAELAAGKRNVTTWNAITQQFQDAEHAVAESLNSVGSAAEENEKYLNSVSGKVTLFESAVEDLSNSAIDSDFIKFIVDLGTVGVKGLDGFIEKFGMLTTLLTTGGLVAGIKNVGQGHRVLADIAYPC